MSSSQVTEASGHSVTWSAELLEARDVNASAFTPSAGPAITPTTWSTLSWLVEAVVLALAALAAVLGSAGLQLSWSSQALAAAFPLFVLASLFVRRPPNDLVSTSLLDTLAQTLGIVSLSAMLLIAVDTTLGGPHPIALSLRLWAFSMCYLLIAQVGLHLARGHAVRAGRLATPTLILGAGVIAENIVTRLRRQPSYGLTPIVQLEIPASPEDGSAVPESDMSPNGDFVDRVNHALDTTGASRVIVAFSSKPDAQLVSALEACLRRGVRVALVPRMYELVNDRSMLDHVGGLPLVTLRRADPLGWQFAVKHAIDRVAAAVCLVLLSPVLLGIALAVRLSSPGPILFRQRRVGRDGHEFDLLKFRTMVPTPSDRAYEPPQGVAPGGVEGEDRRTRVGAVMRRTSLDELPQLINVLRGDMSFVGPRPERPQYVQRFTAEVEKYQSRHRVKSGITGWAQVHGLRGQTSIADRVEWDNFYIQNWSLGLDLRIVALTLIEVLRFRG
jgi:exopolysaccharide biosynthesis polyprenyl glycosylphosphotransferase